VAGLIIAVVLLSLICLALTVMYLIQRYRLYRLTENLEDFLTRGGEPLAFSVREDSLAPLHNACAELENRLLLSQEKHKEECRRTSDLTADISHQLKTPLSSIKLFCEMADSEYLPRQLSQIERMERLIHSLLKLERLCADGYEFNFSEQNVDELILRVWSGLSPSFPACSLNMTGKACIRCDEKWLSEAFANLLKNACEHMPEGGTIYIKMEMGQRAFFCTLEDEGGGASVRDLPHLFERFYRAEHSPENGAGIGLAIVKEILWRHHGTIRAENTEHGLKMEISIPILK